MKALTVMQPWASLIILGHKDIENRTWPTWYRGRLLIHSSKRGYDSSADLLCQTLGIAVPADCPQGVILGEVDLVDCVELPSFKESPVHFLGPWAFGPWCWKLELVTRFDAPIACRGSLGLWTPPAELLGAEFRTDGLPPAETGRRNGRMRSDDPPRLF